MSETTPEPTPPKPRRAGRLLRLLILLLVLAGAGWLIQDWVIGRQQNVFIQDSRIASDMITIGAQEGGLITDLTVATGDRIARGQVLAQLDDRALTLEIDETRATLVRLQAERAQLDAEQVLEQARIAASIETATARIAVSSARLQSVEALLAQARREVQRAEDLHRRKVVASRAVDDARAVQADLDARRLEARAAIVEARAQQREAEAERQRKGVMAQRKAAADAELAALTARLGLLETRQADRAIVSGIDGVVDQTFIEIGEYVRPGQRLLMIHNPGNVWVAANVKETELNRFAVGSVADITIDAFPDRALQGRVKWIAPAATSQFALLPNPNPSGNFTKVTQRVPIRIELDGDLSGLRPGMMVEVAIKADR